MKRVIVLLGVMILAVSGCASIATVEQWHGAEEDAIELAMWSIAIEGDAFHAAHLRAIELFEENHHGVTIQFETFDNETYKTMIRLAVATNELADIFFTWGGGFSRPFVTAGKVLDVTDFYEAYQAYLPLPVLDNVRFGGRIYGSVFTTSISMMFYNQRIFREHNLQAPTTWEEWLMVCQALIDAEITPMSISGKETWVLAMLHDGLALLSAGPEKVRQVLYTGEKSYNSDAFLASAQMLRDLVEMGAFSRNAIRMSNADAVREFCSAETAMFITGNWGASSIWTDAEEPANFGVIPIPGPENGRIPRRDFMGGASDALMAFAYTEHPEWAGIALFELTREISRYAYLDGAAIPAWKFEIDDYELNPLTKRMEEFVANAYSFTPWFDTLLMAEDAEGYLSLLSELFMGMLTAEEFVVAMDEQLSQRR